MTDTWGGYDRNVYYSPEACGMRLIGQLEDAKASYSFDTVIVVQDVETGALYAAHDSGCSCPVPFEDVRGVGDLVPIRSAEDFAAFVASHGDPWVDWPQAERSALRRKVRDALKRETRAC